MTSPLQQKVLRKISSLRLCGCGSDAQWDVVLILLLKASNPELHGGFYDPTDDASSRWVEFGGKVLDSWELTDHGTGIGYQWLTEEGKELLSFLQEFGTDDSKWPKEDEDD